jgi:hypothetical protein
MLTADADAAGLDVCFISFLWCTMLPLQVGDASMVMSLASLQGVEDRNLLAGSLLVLLERDYNQAQVQYLDSLGTSRM